MEAPAQCEQALQRLSSTIAVAGRSLPQHGTSRVAQPQLAILPARCVVHSSSLAAGAGGASRPSSITEATVSVTPSISSKAANSSS